MNERYLVVERSMSDIDKYGSKDAAIIALSKELELYESMWGKYSSDCLGHGITCTRLKLEYLKQLNDNDTTGVCKEGE